MKPIFAATACCAALFLGGCAGLPTEPDVIALPGTGKSLEQFRADHAQCRAYAAPKPDSKGGYYDAQRRYDIAYTQCMYAAGHRVPVPAATLVEPGSATWYPATSPPPGMSAPASVPPPGTPAPK
ncbi:MAG: hypothetical protein KF778_14555 [Rhodocyclaceae bacterium]|nr:hypothetical protein [Rhodocyclaceae bacterium]MBX3669618.1 hypothetical protein [Rhodocyclaceae bacterium]